MCHGNMSSPSVCLRNNILKKAVSTLDHSFLQPAVHPTSSSPRSSHQFILAKCPTPKPPLSQKTACLRLRKTTSSKKHPVSRYFLPQIRIFIPSSRPQVFAGNLAYSTTEEGLKAFFAPVQSDMYLLLSSPSFPPLTSSQRLSTGHSAR